MANNVDFTQEIQAFQSARYGAEVRDAMVSATEKVQEAVNAQLIDLDNTLTVSGAGADAKVVGDFRAVAMSGNGTLENNTNLNNVTAIGFYYLSNTNTYVNSPLGNYAGYMYVAAPTPEGGTPSGNYCQQVLISANGVIYTRRRYAGDWNAWVSFSQSLNELRTVTMSGQGTLAYNTDLDDVVDIGIYYISNQSIYTNNPLGAYAGYLYVANATPEGGTPTGNYCQQIAVSVAGSIWIRRKAAGEWNEWMTIGSDIIAAAVDDWLDRHPEVVSVIPDGSITFRKLSSDLRNYQVVDDSYGLYTSVAPFVYVIHNNSSSVELNKRSGNDYSDYPMGDGAGCWFRTFTNNTGIVPKYGGYPRANGTVVFAMPNQAPLPEANAPINDIMDVFGTYYDRGDIAYGRTNTLFNPNYDSSGTKEIDCACMMYALLYGIRFENSKYNGNTENKFGYYSICKTPESRFENVLYITELLEYFAEHKRLFEIPTNVENPMVECGIAPGDILFTSSQDTTSGWSEDYYSSGHVQMVLKTYPESGYALIAQATGSGVPASAAIMQDVLANNNDYKDRTVRLSIIDVNGQAGQYYQVFARPDYGKTREYSSKISEGESLGEVTIAGETLWTPLAELTPYKALVSGQPYTLAVKGTLPRYDVDYGYVVIRCYATVNGVSKTFDIRPTYRTSYDESFLCVPFFLPYEPDIFYVDSIVLGARMESGASGGTYEVESISLVEGVYDGSVSLLPTPPTSDGTYVLKMVVENGVADYRWTVNT